MFVKDRVVIITGASRGIGRSAAREFAYEGAHVVVAARATNELQSLVQEIEREYKTKAVAVRTDVSRKADVDSLISRAMDVFGRIDVLVNNAGMGFTELSRKPTSGTSIRWLGSISKECFLRQRLSFQ